MPPSPPPLPRRDRIAIGSALVGLTLIAWYFLIAMDAGMSPAMMQEMGYGGVRPWSAADFALMFAMWAVMMVGMMVPTAMPVTLIYAAVARKAARQRTPVAPTALFVSGYVAMWTLFSVVATLAQWGLDRAALLSPMLVTTSPELGATILIGAGFYQLTPVKQRCLQHCRAPAHFISERFRPGSVSAFRMGWVHGAYCLGCCWLLMGLLFFGGVMSLVWIGGITFFVLAEKILPFGDGGGRLAGWALVGTGVVLLVRSMI